LQYISKITLLFTLLFILLSSLFIGANASTYETVTSRQALEQSLVKHKGKVVYLDFWASWCVPCKRSFPWMNNIQAKYKDKGFTVISVNLDAEQSLAKKFLVINPATFDVIYDPKGKIAKHFKIQGMPSSMIIGRDGKIKSRHTGFFNKKIPEYQQEIEALLTGNK